MMRRRERLMKEAENPNNQEVIIFDVSLERPLIGGGIGGGDPDAWLKEKIDFQPMPLIGGGDHDAQLDEKLDLK